MAKYYIESGDFRLVVQAHTARGAALWAVHRALAQVVSFEDEPDLAGTSHEAEAATPGRLAGKVSAHQQGFGRADAQQFDTFELVTQWNHLMTAIDRLQQHIEPLAA